jgi:hypothetical protein
MKKLTFNEWQIYLILELRKDYKKLKLNNKPKSNENKLQKVSSR